MRKSNCLWLLLVAVLLLPAQEMAAKKKKEKEVTDRELWAGALYRMAAPVLSNMSEGKPQEPCGCWLKTRRGAALKISKWRFPF